MSNEEEIAYNEGKSDMEETMKAEVERLKKENELNKYIGEDLKKEKEHRKTLQKDLIKAHNEIKRLLAEKKDVDKIILANQLLEQKCLNYEKTLAKLCMHYKIDIKEKVGY